MPLPVFTSLSMNARLPSERQVQRHAGIMRRNAKMPWSDAKNNVGLTPGFSARLTRGERGRHSEPSMFQLLTGFPSFSPTLTISAFTSVSAAASSSTSPGDQLHAMPRFPSISLTRNRLMGYLRDDLISVSISAIRWLVDHRSPQILHHSGLPCALGVLLGRTLRPIPTRFTALVIMLRLEQKNFPPSALGRTRNEPPAIAHRAAC
jgi:hypothetical protein